MGHSSRSELRSLAKFLAGVARDAFSHASKKDRVKLAQAANLVAGPGENPGSIENLITILEAYEGLTLRLSKCWNEIPKEVRAELIAHGPFRPNGWADITGVMWAMITIADLALRNPAARERLRDFRRSHTRAATITRRQQGELSNNWVVERAAQIRSEHPTWKLGRIAREMEAERSRNPEKSLKADTIRRMLKDHWPDVTTSRGGVADKHMDYRRSSAEKPDDRR